MNEISLADITPGQLDEMRAWIDMCEWPDLDPGDVDQLTDAEVFAGVRFHYVNGVAGFLEHYQEAHG